MNIPEKVTSCRAALAGLSIFSDLKAHPLLLAFSGLLETAESAAAPLNSVVAKSRAFSAAEKNLPEALELCRAWAAFAGAFVRYAEAPAELSAGNNSFYGMIAFLALGSDNSFTRAMEYSAKRPAAGTEIALPPVLKAAAASDLDRLGSIAAFDISGLGFYLAGLLRDRGLEEAARHIEAEARAFWANEGAAGTAPGGNGDGEGSGGGEGDAGIQLFPKNGGWSAAMPAFSGHVRNHGAGEMGQHRFFSWSGGGLKDDGCSGSPIRPVLNPDPVRLADLCGYEEQRSVVISNTLRFLGGKPANNILLYGDRGTGKSATIKAVCREYAERGLRLLEVRKQDLFELPRILDALAVRALRFIVFIDDLSFEASDDSFTALKALLEGGIETRPANTAIYATSNRRHLVKERFADRPSLAEAAAGFNGEVRAFDAMQEQISLADRFGLTVVFTTPSQDEYLAIAEFIARRRGLLGAAADGTADKNAPPSNAAAGAEAGEALRKFRENALRWEKWFNGRSPRTALQFVDWAAGGTDFPWE
ncbi:MAG: ATP-binding protein [Treponema sp.]|jgi:predicted AAA+ superfamily ATPase|nr:ATP-binding protein [Treponema sp.]